MSLTNPVSITLPQDLLLQAESAAASREQTVSDLVGKALRTYLRQSQDWEELRQYSRTKARELGLNTQDDIDRMIHEDRESKRQAR